MRVTQSMLNTQMLNNYNKSLTRYDNLQNQMSTGKVINKPSDDPVGIGYSLRYRNAISENDQYQRNTDSAISWIDYTETMVSETNDVLQRARELAVKGANGTLSDDAMKAIGAEIEQLYDHLVSIGNTKFNGKYIFNGQMTDVKPYDSTNAQSVDTHNGNISLETSNGVVMSVNLSGSSLFGSSTDSTNAFRVLDDLKNGLNNNDQAAISQAIGDLDSRIDNVLEKWAEIGAKSNRLELTKNRLEDENNNLKNLLSKVEDVDMAELIIKLKSEESVYQAALSSGARIIQPSLVDYLR